MLEQLHTISGQLNQLKTNTTALQASIETHLQYRRRLQDELVETLKQIDNSKHSIECFEKAIVTIHLLINTTRKEVYDNLAGVVNYGLKEVFGADTEFKIEPDMRGNVPTCKFYLKTAEYPEWTELSRTCETHGGGIQEVCSFLLQLVIHKVAGCQFKTFVMDERFRQLSKGHIEALAQLMFKMNKIFGLQFVVITHDPAIVEHAEKVVELG